MHSHLLKNSIESEHEVLKINDYKINGKGYRNNARMRQIAEALVMKEMKTILNKQ